MKNQSKFIKDISQRSRIFQRPWADLISKYSKSQCKKFNISDQEQDQSIQVHKKQLTSLKYIGIYDRKFIITYSNQLRRFAYIDQHAIHQRIRYEYYILRFLEELNINNLTSKAKLARFDSQRIQKNSTVPIKVLGKRIKVLIKVPKKKRINQWGFQFVQHENASYVTSYIEIFGYRLQEKDVKRICQQIDQDQERVPKYIDFLIGETACKRAIKFNDLIDQKWSQSLLYNASLCDFPFYCVHGRPTIKFIKSKPIYKS